MTSTLLKTHNTLHIGAQKLAKGPVIIYDQGGSGVKRLFTENIFAAYTQNIWGRQG